MLTPRDLFDKFLAEDYFYRLSKAREVVKCANLEEWAEWMAEHRSDCVVDQVNVGMYFISTVFTGINHRFFSNGPPILFETMMFAEDAEQPNFIGEVVVQRWYCTWDQAERGHKVALRYARLLWRNLNRGIDSYLSRVPTSTEEPPAK